MEISSCLKIGRGLTAIIGGGGKTTLMYTLAEELRERGTVLICTSTHIRVPRQYPLIKQAAGQDPSGVLEQGLPAGRQNPEHDMTDDNVGSEDEAAHIRAELEKHGVVCVGTPAEGGKLSSPQMSFARLEELADYVLVEADGSKGLPLKAHAPHEPVIPENTKTVILVVGADGFGRPVSEVCHRPELWAARAGLLGGNEEDEAGEEKPEAGESRAHSEDKAGTEKTTATEDRARSDAAVTVEGEAHVIAAEGFGDRIYVNKCETEAELELARKLKERTGLPTVAGSLHQGVYVCL